MIVNGSALAVAGMNANAVEVNRIADKKILGRMTLLR